MGQFQLRYSWYGQKLPGQMLHEQMLPWQLESVLDVPKNQTLKFHQNRVSKSCDIANFKFLWWWWWMGCAKSFLCLIYLRLCLVEVDLSYCWVGVLTNVQTRLKLKVFSLESWDIADMDKCPLDKCRGDSCNLMYMFPGPFV